MLINYNYTIKIIGVLFLGALGALLFNLFVLPYMISSPYFDQFQFVKDFKQGKIIINPKESVYIQENSVIEDSIEKVKKSIAVIQSTKLGLKTGLIITSDGLLVTLANAIPLNGSFNVFIAGESVSFKVLKVDVKNNLALIKIDKENLSTVGFTNANKIKLGQNIFLVASISIKQDNWVANEGIISQINEEFIQTNISDSKNVEGSPLFNIAGELVGITFVNKEGKISVIPVNKIQELLGL
ncbi:MAG: hypothetical protein A3C58_02300 [Candidatus Staskawiczbacteria bacterium RIFCSPHIGHO2_02_FULL_34_10]|uniref:Serine protease n=2 Tax=Candidatus Staskawicziibacteriota TaxID=1817916 RepID=A0A1G2HLU8_9BACT|nr:MAG: hypothetical protein A2639_02710 [Candidatus Staskawiczbacteria bacterium RIFCSPHIGHO2_01_FULL_34_27]OGZ65867.1 MAG: hypothetical protein A3C58_02300 [Candidatus Staskawiczbacteria bacterium RIFCSPHIGHO2_02_FULL_34_10]